MPRAINKHKINTNGEATSVRHQRNAPIRHFGIIGGSAFIWVEETEGMTTRRYAYRTLTTGEEIPDYYEYLATAQDPATGISAHLFKENA